MLTLKRILRQLATTDGAEIAEAALVLPLVFMLLLGIVWFGRAFNIYSTIHAGGAAGSDHRGALRHAPSCWQLLFPPIVTVDNAIDAVMQASSLDPTQIPPNSNPPAPVSCVNPPERWRRARTPTTSRSVGRCC